MSKNSIPRFDVGFRERLEQSRAATNAVRLPRLGYRQYRVYELEKKKDNSAPYSQYGQHIGRGIRKGNINVTMAGGQAYQYSSGWIYQITIKDKLETLFDPPHTIKWLKPKQATLLRLRGHRVEEHG